MKTQVKFHQGTKIIKSFTTYDSNGKVHGEHSFYRIFNNTHDLVLSIEYNHGTIDKITFFDRDKWKEWVMKRRIMKKMFD